MGNLKLRSLDLEKKCKADFEVRLTDYTTGCITCKAKRLKCDETKPTCQQCLKRAVTCGGYKKDFKWRPFEEATFVNKPVAPKTKRGMDPNALQLDSAKL